MSERMATYQTRIAAHPALEAYAQLYGHVERCLFARTRSGQSAGRLKNEFLKQFGITARQFNALRIGLDGKIESIKTRRPELISEAGQRITQTERSIQRIQARLDALRNPLAAFKKGKVVRTLAPAQRQTAIDKSAANLHQKKRRLVTLNARHAAMVADHKAGIVRLCFGSRKLFRAQFDLEANGYASHEDWLRDWQSARSDQFSIVGSKDETAGNQSCQAVLAADGSLTLKLRLPEALGYGKTLDIPGVRFAYGHDQILSALDTSRRVPATTQAGKAIVKRIGTALSYRFVRDGKGWRVFVSVAVPDIKVETQASLGAFGVDTNAEHLAVAETDRTGNLINTWRIDLPLYGKTTEQAKALIGDACVEVARMAQAAGKPVVIEKLDFAKKKAELRGTNPRQARMLSSFNCNKFSAGIDSACFRAGVEVIEVNPAYTSVIGAVNHAQIRGISVHMGAAYAIARRGLGLSEAPAVRTVLAPVRNGGHVTFVLPVRNRAKHVWTQWAAIRTKLKAAHVAHYRSGRSKEMPAPLSPEMRALGASWSSTAQSRGANRQEHCSPGVLDDVPW